MLNNHLSPRGGSGATTLKYESLLPPERRTLSSPSCMKKAPGMGIYGCRVLVEIEGRHNREGSIGRPLALSHVRTCFFPENGCGHKERGGKGEGKSSLENAI